MGERQNQWRRSCLFGLLAGAIGLGVADARAATHYVSLDGHAVSPYTNWYNAATSLVQALSAVPSGEAGNNSEILVSNGTYFCTATFTWDTTWKYRKITVRSLYGSTNTILDGTNLVPNASWSYGFYLNATSMLQGFTFTNFLVNAVAYRDGPGTTNDHQLIDCVFVGSPVDPVRHVSGNHSLSVSNCVIRDNWASGIGGNFVGYLAVYDSVISGNRNGGIVSTPTKAMIVRDSTISGNARPGGGGGIYGNSGTGIIYNCVITGNSATNGSGGGVSGAVTIENCVISSNYAAGHGGGIYNATRVSHCTIADNVSSNYGGGTRGCQEVSYCRISGNYAKNGGGGIYGSASVRNCLVVHNRSSGLDYAGQGGGIGSGGVVANCTVVSNISDWVSGGVFRSSCVNSIIYDNAAPGANDNYWVNDTVYMPWTNCITMPDPATVTVGGTGCITSAPMLDVGFKPVKGSPAINAGVYRDWMDGALDLDGQPRISQDAVDIGAFEFQASAGTVMVVR